MMNVDLIIKYLSGDMKQDEAGSFEKDLASNPGLKKEFEEVSYAYKLIRVQLRKRDEASFRAKLMEVMEKSSPKLRGKSSFQWPRWYYYLPLAGSLAIVMAIFLMNQGSERILSRFFNPQNDPVVLAYNQGTRGDSESGIYHYQKGRYAESMDEISQLLVRDPENQVAFLFYLLSSMELARQDEVIDKIWALPIDTENLLGQSLTWYSCLALVKSGRREEAAKQLLPLSEQVGPYQANANRLRKRLLK